MKSTSSDAEILAEIRGALRDALGVDPPRPIDAETRLFADLGLASIDAVVLGEALQARRGRTLPFEVLLADLGRRRERDLEIGELIQFVRNYV
jgi:acyl carrier protein